MNGKQVKIPEGYQGWVVKKAEGESNPTNHEDRDIIKNHAESKGGQILQKFQLAGFFGKVVLWGHESSINPHEVFAKSIDEWLGFCEAVRLPFRNGQCRRSISADLWFLQDAPSGRCCKTMICHAMSSRFSFSRENLTLDTIPIRMQIET